MQPKVHSRFFVTTKEIKKAFYKAKARDNFRCRVCKRSVKKLAIHHIDGSGSLGMYSDSNNNLDNLMTLCFSCHTTGHARYRQGVIDSLEFDKHPYFVKERLELLELGSPDSKSLTVLNSAV